MASQYLFAGYKGCFCFAVITKHENYLSIYINAIIRELEADLAEEPEGPYGIIDSDFTQSQEHETI